MKVLTMLSRWLMVPGAPRGKGSLVVFGKVSFL